MQRRRMIPRPCIVSDEAELEVLLRELFGEVRAPSRWPGDQAGKRLASFRK